MKFKEKSIEELNVEFLTSQQLSKLPISKPKEFGKTNSIIKDGDASFIVEGKKRKPECFSPLFNSSSTPSIYGLIKKKVRKK